MKDARSLSRGSLISAGIAVLGYLLVLAVAVRSENYWDALPYWSLQIASAAFPIWLFAICAQRLSYNNRLSILPKLGIAAVVLSKTYLGIVWTVAANQEFEMGAAIWTVIVEPPAVAAILIPTLYFIWRGPAQNTFSNRPNPNEVPQ